MQYVNLCCSADEKFVMPLAVTLFSAITNIKSYNVNIYLITSGITIQKEKKLQDVVRSASTAATLRILHIDQKLLSHLNTPGHLSLAAYFRILIPELLPVSETKTIYLDSDLLIRGDLSILWQMDMMGMPLMAVRDYSAPVISSKAAGLIHLVPPLHPETPYLNSGLMVIDIDLWRAERISQKILTYSSINTSLYGDQDGINAVIAGRWLELDPLWNVQVYISQQKIVKTIEPNRHLDNILNKKDFLLKKAIVYHFVGNRKPWALGCGLPGQRAWLKSLGKSGWHTKYEHFKFSTFLYFDIIFRMFTRKFRDAIQKIHKNQP